MVIFKLTLHHSFVLAVGQLIADYCRRDDEVFVGTEFDGNTPLCVGTIVVARWSSGFDGGCPLRLIVNKCW